MDNWTPESTPNNIKDLTTPHSRKITETLNKSGEFYIHFKREHGEIRVRVLEPDDVKVTIAK